MAKIAVTGATGFIGKTFYTRAAAAGHEIVAMIRDNKALKELPINVHKCIVRDLGNTDEFARCLEKVDIVVHLADRADRLNPAGTSFSPSLMENVIAAAGMAGVTDIVFASSIYASLDEHGTPNVYGRGKRDAERLLTAAAHLRGIILRLPPVYGQGSAGSISLLSRMVGKKLPLPFKNATAPRDYLFIDNLTDLILTIVCSPADVRESARGRVFEPSDGEAVGTARLVEMIASAMNREAKLFAIPSTILRPLAKAIGKQSQVEAAFDPMRTAGNEDLSTLFGWEPRQKMPQSLHFLAG